MSTDSLSTEELRAFLEDVRSNIDADDNTDFKKLIFYLFNFANEKILSNDEQQISDIFGVIEMVFERKGHLINSVVNKKDIEKIYVPDDIGSNDLQLFEWYFSFSLHHLGNITTSSPIINDIKVFVMNCIKLITSRLNNMKYTIILRNRLIEEFDKILAYLFENLGRRNFDLIQKLFCGVHLFSVLNDHNVTGSLHLFGFQLKLESYSRKLWYLFGELTVGEIEIPILNNLKSLFLLNLSTNACLNYSGPWNQIALVLRWMEDYIKHGNHKAPNNDLLAKSVSRCLLMLFKLCTQKKMTSSYVNSIHMDQLLCNLPPALPSNILQCIHLVNYIHAQISQKIDVTSSYQLTNLNQLIIKPFEDVDLESLRFELLDVVDTNYKRTISYKLMFMKGTWGPQNVHSQDNKYNFSTWYSYVISVISDESKSQDKLKRDDLYSLITALGNFPCFFNQDFDFGVGACSVCGTYASRKNFYEQIKPHRKSVRDINLVSRYYKEVICDYFLKEKLSVLAKDPMMCCNYLLTIFKLFASFSPPKGSPENEPVFKFIFQQLSCNTNRDVRLLCARILPLYLIQVVDRTRDQAFKFIFKKISSIEFSCDNRKQFAESTIKALCDLSIISSGEWLCVLVIKLSDLFGEKNDQHVNYVYNGFLHIASSKSITPYKLLSPYLPSIAERIIRKPRMFSKMTELLGVTKSYFLYRTKDYTTPRFLEYYKHDFIQDIADASNTSKWKLIAKSLPRIMAAYLVKEDEIKPDYILTVLGNVSPEFKALTIDDLVSGVGEITWFILLHIQVDEDTDKIMNESRITNALACVAKLNMKHKGIDMTRMSKDDCVRYLLREHILELVQKFSENVHHIKGTKPYLEKVSSLRAIIFLIEREIGAVVTALGQISTCLQASISNPDFELLSIKSWNSLIQNLPSHHLISLLDVIVSLIFQRFKYFEASTKEISIEILRKIFEEINEKHNRYCLYYLSIPFLEQIQDYKPINTFRATKPISKSRYFQEYKRRLNTNNKYVVQQALDDIIHFTSTYQLNCQQDYFKDSQASEYISELIRTLLETASKFRNTNREVSTSCAKVLSIIGSLDSNKFSHKSIKKSIIIVHDFCDYKENVEFLVDFIENKVLNIFWASNDPVKQLFSAYAMQKFLQVLKLDSRVVNGKPNDFAKLTWNKFSEIAKSTLTPLLSSKYVSPRSRFETIKFPFFKLSMRYETWLVDFTSNLLKRPINFTRDNSRAKESSKEVIMQTCAMLIRDHDITLCQYLLKYVCLSHIISGSRDVFSDIRTEFLSILQMDSSSSFPDKAESLKGCYQSIFEVLDYCNEWVSAAHQHLNDYQISKSDVTKIKHNIELCDEFLKEIPMELIAIKSAECDSYERTIFYLEKCFRDGKADESYNIGNLNVISTLQSMYSNINDFDALNGVLRSFSTNNLTDKLVTFQYNENWSLAQESFQVLGDTGPDSDRVKYNTKYLKSLSDHGLYDEVLSNLASRINLDNINTIPFEWSTVGLQAAVASGEYSHISKWLYIIKTIGKPSDVETMINYELANALVNAFKSNSEGFDRHIHNVYDIIGTALVPPASSSFTRNSNLMNQLHVLYDLRAIIDPHLASNISLRKDNDKVLTVRRSNMDQAFDSQSKVLTMHQVALHIVNDNKAISDTLLLSSSIARHSGRFDISTRSIMKSMALSNQEANIEYTELLWAEGRQTEAIKSLSKLINDDNFKDDLQKSKVQLQYAEWLDETNHSSSSTIISEYTKAFKIHNSWEKPYYDLGKYFNKIMESKSDSTGYYEHQIIRHFLKALALGNSFIFEALPKLITIWLDFAQGTHLTKEADRRLNQIILDVEKYVDNIQIYVWYTSITQILSRIVHHHTASSSLINLIITKIVKAYPKHSLWYVLSHLNSNDKVRKSRVKLILRDLQLSSPAFGDIISNSSDLFQSFISIADFKIQKRSVKKMSLTTDFRASHLVNPYECLVIPVRSNLEIRLPSSFTSDFSAFPKSASVTFDGFDDIVNIFHSLQMPRQVTIRGSNLQAYRLMIKKDDTRKDAKVVEFTTMINRLLAGSSKARKRNLLIANYAVIPLAENMGVIEFVSDVATLKSVVADQRKSMGLVINERKIFMKLDEAQKSTKPNRYNNATEALENLVSLFNRICQDNPPVLHNWLIKQFPDPTVWYLARNSFTRSSAVMSIVGYIVGLGDRHCENILLFKKNGSVLHIDFDCLFEKGKTLPTPEIVPFRLTQNMIDAMGITGIEGSFRITSEVTIQLLRENEAPLMNILETLLYDPLLDWKTQQNPQEHLRKVRRKIRGLINEKEELPMNTHGQVDMLIQESSSVENLSQMYGGWAPYI